MRNTISISKRLESLLADSQALPVDERLKIAQIAKIEDELKRAEDKWSFETISKLGIALLAAATAAWAFILGLPQAKLDLYDAEKKLIEKRQELALKQAEVNDRNITLADLSLREQSLMQRIEVLRVLVSQAPAGTAAQKTTKAEVTKLAAYVTFAGSIKREVMTALEQKLTNNGYIAPRSVRQSAATMNQVKFAANLQNGRTIAESVATLTEKHLAEAGCIVPKLQVVATDSTIPIEISILGNCK